MAWFRCGGGKSYNFDNPRVHLTNLKSQGSDTTQGINHTVKWSSETVIPLLNTDKYIYLDANIAGGVGDVYNDNNVLIGRVRYNNSTYPSSQTIDLSTIDKTSYVKVIVSGQETTTGSEAHWQILKELKVY